MQEGIPKIVPSMGYKGVSEVSEKIILTTSTGMGPVETAILQGNSHCSCLHEGAHLDDKREFREQGDLGKRVETYQYTAGEFKPIFTKERIEGENFSSKL